MFVTLEPWHGAMRTAAGAFRDSVVQGGGITWFLFLILVIGFFWVTHLPRWKEKMFKGNRNDAFLEGKGNDLFDYLICDGNVN